MDVDEVSIGKPMEVDDVEVRPKQRVVRVTVDAVVPTGEPMEVDPVPAQRWPVLPCPAWNVDAADCAPAQRWPVLPRPAWNVDMADYAKASPALIVGGTRVARRSPLNRQAPDLAINNRWLKISRAPDHNIYNEPTTVEDDDDDDTDDSSLVWVILPLRMRRIRSEIDFAEADTSLNWAPRILTPETPHRIQRMTLFSPLSPVRRSKLDEGDIFITSKRQTADLITKNGWLKTSHPGRNIHNESVFCGNEYADYLYLALAYPLVEDSNTTAA
ncbi:hypothetical protein JOM56_008137 [Amanita muscaria]